MNKRVVIWGDDHHNALGLLRMLGGRGLDVLLIVRKRTNIATSSKYCTRFVEIPDLCDALDFLLASYTDKDHKAVLLFTADRYSEFANHHLSKLTEFFYVAGPAGEGLLEQIDDKYYMSKAASNFSFLVPKTVLITNGSADLNHFPIIIKPCRPVSKDFKTIVVKNEAQLAKVLHRLVPNNRYIAQAYIQKEADCLIYGCRTFSGETTLAGACIRTRWSDDGCGSFGFITPKLPNGISETSIVDYLESVNFHGLFSVEYGLKDNSAFFYEFNLRNDGTSHLFYQAGANVALAFVEDCFGLGAKESKKVTREGFLINEFWDKFNVNDHIISKNKYLEDFKKATIFFYYDPDDMEPYIIQKSKSFARSLRRFISKTRLNKLRLYIKNYLNRRKN